MNKIKWLILLVGLGITQGMAQQEAITKGVEWLKGTQNTSGSWGDEEMIASAVIDTTAVLDTFYYLNETDASYTKGIEWLGTQSVFSCSLLARIIKTLAESGTDTSNLVDLLLTYQREDGGFGGYGIGNLDTFLALSALKSANYPNTTVIESALWYLISNQNDDGGFGFDESNVYLTSLAILSLNQYKDQFYLTPNIEKAKNWLILQTPETLWEKAIAYSASAECRMRNY
ncbi:MAG: prenyltransferase/squalene oxidase repeat-containing protein [bacterium]